MSTLLEQYIFTTKTDDITTENLAELYGSVGFGDAADYKEIENFHSKTFGPGVFGVFCFSRETKELIGMVRCLSDDFMCTWISEVCIHPASQRKGVGSELLKMTTARFKHTAIYTEAFDDGTNQEEFFATQGLYPKAKLLALSRAAEEDAPFIH